MRRRAPRASSGEKELPRIALFSFHALPRPAAPCCVTLICPALLSQVVPYRALPKPESVSAHVATTRVSLTGVPVT